MNNEKLNSTPKLSIAKREIFRICKDPVYFFCMLVAPTICVVFFLSLMKEGLPTDMPVAVVDLDGSSNSRNLARQLDAFEQTKVMLTTVSFEEARQASLLFRDMKTMSVLAGASVGLQTGLAHGYTENQIMAQLQPIVIDTHAIGNPWLNYSVYLNNTLLPGVLQLMIFLVTVLSIGSEIKYSTAREWLQMGGNSLTVSLIGKIFPHTVIFTIVAFLYAVALYGFNSFPLNSGWLPMLSALFLLVIASQAVGIFMIGVLPTFRLGLSSACLFGMIAFSIVGFSFPVLGMDPTLQALSNLFPLRHYFLIYVDQALNGRPFFYSWAEYAWLMGFLVLPFLIGKNLKNALLYFKYIP